MSKTNLDYFRDLPPFRDLSEENIAYLEKHLQTVDIEKGQVLFYTGDAGDSFYIIKSGKIRVFIEAPVSGEKIILSTLTDGDFFGEMALLTGGPRSASIETLTKSSLLKLDKKCFEKILKDNPQISISISNMLSQRLMQANLQRAASEQFYQSKISPSGSLEDHSVIDIMKFCEENSLTGKLFFEHDEEQAEISFLKGNVQNILLGDLEEAEAMDALTEWKKGKFRIEPSLFSLEENTVTEKKELSKTGTKKSESREKAIDIPTVLEKFVRLSFVRLINLVGSQKLKEINTKVYAQCLPFFPVLEKCAFEVIPEIKVDLKKIEHWSDKETLAIAVYLETIFKSCHTLVFGMSHLDLEDLAGEDSEILRNISFFEYMKHAKEFAL